MTKDPNKTPFLLHSPLKEIQEWMAVEDTARRAAFRAIFHHIRSSIMVLAGAKRPNVLIIDRKRKRPFLPELSELLPGLLDAAAARTR